MKRNVARVVLVILPFLLGGVIYPAWADSFPPVVLQPAQIIIQRPVIVQQPAPIIVQQQPVLVQQQPVIVQQQPVVVEQQPVVIEPYPVVERGVTIMVDPENYYYDIGGVYYHHYYKWDRDVVVERVPPGYRYLHAKIDLSKVSERHFHHADYYRHFHPGKDLRKDVKKDIKKDHKEIKKDRKGVKHEIDKLRDK